MTRKSTKSASRKWSGPRPTPEAVRTPPYGFRVPQQNASVHADPWSSGECRLRSKACRVPVAPVGIHCTPPVCIPRRHPMAFSLPDLPYSHDALAPYM